MEQLDVGMLVEALIEREGGYVDHPADKGGPTCFGITEAVARAHGYAGPMRHLPRHEAAAIYRRLYWLRPAFDQVARRSPTVAAELFDTGVNMGPAVAATFLQRALTALNRNGKDYPDLVPDGRIGAVTLAALDAFLGIRGNAGGQTVLLRATSAPSTKGLLMISKLAWLTLALVLTACSTTPPAPQPIPVLAEQHRCPAYPLPPEALLKPPAKTDFLPRTR